MLTFLGQFLRHARNRMIVAWLRLRGVKFGPEATIDPGVGVHRGVTRNHPGQISAGARLRCGRGVILNAHGGSIALGSQVYLGPYTVVYGHGSVVIGDNALIAMHCCILSSNHTVAPLGTPINSQPDVLLPTRLGADVWLGARVTVLGGVTIGDGCVVGAGSVVTKDLPPGSVAVGVPARIIRQRQ